MSKNKPPTTGIDDSKLGLFPFSPVCSLCQHRKVGDVPRRCAAFGDTPIPRDIWLGDDHHLTPREGDHGMVFTARDPEKEG